MGMAVRDLNEQVSVQAVDLLGALEHLRPELVALTEKELLRVNLDPLASVSIARGALPALRGLCLEAKGEPHTLDEDRLLQLELYAFALTQAQTSYKLTRRRTRALKELGAASHQLRARLLSDITVLVERGLIPSNKVARLRGPNGYRNIASDLLILALVLRESWAQIEHKTAITEEEINRAEDLGNILVTAVAVRHEVPEQATKASDIRQRAYTLFVRAYDEVRRIVSYLRWHAGDADIFAPSLYAKRKASKRRRKVPVSMPATAEAPETTVAVAKFPDLDRNPTYTVTKNKNVKSRIVGERSSRKPTLNRQAGHTTRQREKIMTDSNSINTNGYPALAESFEATLPKMSALEPNQLLQVLVDPVAAVGISRGAMPKILAYREALSKLADFDITNVDQLPVYASAALHANRVFVMASAPPEHFRELIEEAAKARENLLSDVTALANRGIIASTQLGELKGPVGYRNIASDVLALVGFLVSNWDKVASRTAVTTAELERAEAVANQLVGDIGVRAQSPAVIAACALNRQRSYTVHANAYDETRRGLSYLRWREGDVDKIAPSLFSGRKRKGTADAEEPDEAAPGEGSTPVATPVVAAAATKPAVGMPGADPFIG